MSKLIMVVDDDPDLSSSMAEVLETEGYRVVVAANGREALHVLENGGDRPALILLDMTMPVMDGWEFRAHQAKMPGAASIPVITVTADGDARGKACSIEARGYLSKPVSVDGLLDTVERIVAP